MSFGVKTPTITPPAPPPSPAILASSANAPKAKGGGNAPAQSLISTSTQGLKRRADTIKTTLIGG